MGSAAMQHRGNHHHHGAHAHSHAHLQQQQHAQRQQQQQQALHAQQQQQQAEQQTLQRLVPAAREADQLLHSIRQALAQRVRLQLQEQDSGRVAVHLHFGDVKPTGATHTHSWCVRIL